MKRALSSLALIALACQNPLTGADCTTCSTSAITTSGPDSCGNTSWEYLMTTETDGTVTVGGGSGQGACKGRHYDCSGSYISPYSQPANLVAYAEPDDSDGIGECSGYFIVTSYSNATYSACAAGSLYPNGQVESSPTPYFTETGRYITTC